VIVADRELVETGSDDILENAKEVDVAFLVVGDPFGYLLSCYPWIEWV
jgi:diphthine synthase